MFHIANLIQFNRPKFSFPPHEKIAFVFGDKPRYIGLLTDLYNQLKNTEAVGGILGKMTTGTPEEDVPLQAADLACYLTRTFWEKDHAREGSAHPRTIRMMRELITTKEFNLEPHFLNRKALEEFVRIFRETEKEAGEWEWNPD